MVRYINKNLKAHSYKGEENTFELLNTDAFNQLTELLTFQVQHLGGQSHSALTHLLQKTTIQLGITRPTDFNFILGQRTKLKDLFLTLELILESFYSLHPTIKTDFMDFIEDINELFLTNQVPLQIRYVSEKKEFYVEKIISEEVSQKIGETLKNISEHEKTFGDFKNSIKEFSSGNYPESIKLCCKSLEDYFCLILGKNSCQNVETHYKEISKKLKISEDLGNRFSNLISYIHKHRSIDSHGRLENVEIPDLDLVNETIIQFTMSILNYLKKKKENVTN